MLTDSSKRDPQESVAQVEPAAGPAVPVDGAALLHPAPAIDPVARYRDYEYLPSGHPDRTKLRDFRVVWSGEGRDPNFVHRMTGGERRARRKYFARLAQKRHTADKAAAVAYALGLHYGPIPELQTEAEFTAYWTRERLTAIAKRWDLEPVGASFAAAKMREARECYLREAPQIADELTRIGKDKNVPWTARVNALLGAARMASEACPTTVEDLGLPPLIAENWNEILALLPQIAARIPNEKRAEMIIGAIREWLAVTKPIEKPSTGPRRVIFEHQAPADPSAPAADGADEVVPPPPPPPNAIDSVEDPTLPSITSPDDADSIEGLINEIVVGDAKVVG